MKMSLLWPINTVLITSTSPPTTTHPIECFLLPFARDQNWVRGIFLYMCVHIACVAHFPRALTYLTHSHVNATVILANVEVKVFVIDSQVTSLWQFPFEAKKKKLEIAAKSNKMSMLTRHQSRQIHPKDPLMHHEIQLSPALEWRFESVAHHVWLFATPKSNQ